MKLPKILSRYSRTEMSIMAVVGALLIVIGFMIVMQQRDEPVLPEPPKQTETVPEVADQEDLIKVEKMLDDVPVDDQGDGNQLDQELSAF